MKNYKEIHIWDLPEDLVYVDLTDEVRKDILNKSIKFAKNWINLGKELGVYPHKKRSSDVIRCLREGYKIRLSLLKKILDYLDSNGCKIDRDFIEKNIIVVATKSNGGSKFANVILNPNLPFDFNNLEGARILSSIFFDGGINSEIEPHYSNKNIKLRELVYNSYIQIFGSINAKFSNYKDLEQIYFPKIIGIILVHSLGLMPGRKTTNNPSVPEFIKDCSKEMKSIFLQQAFDDEGHVHLKQKRLDFKLACINNGYPPNLLIDVRNLLKDFGIESGEIKPRDIYQNKDGQINRKWSFNICYKRNLEIFQKEIEFISEHKSKKLKKILESPYPIQYDRNKANGIILNACKNLEKREGKILSRTLAKEINRTQYRSKQVIGRFVRKGILKVVKPRHGTIGAEYKLQV